MGTSKEKIGGFSFLEVVVALGIACSAAVVAFGLIAAADYQSAKGRAESGITSRIQFYTEKFAAMPYGELQGLVTPGYTQSGFLWESSGGTQLAWSVTAQLVPVASGISVQLTFQWEDPSFGYPRSTPVSRTLQGATLFRAYKV